MKRLAFLLLTILMVCACGGPSKPAPQKHPKIVPGPKIAVVAHHPKIAGVDPTVGQVLNTTNGTWTNSPTSFAYQWQRCSPSCANISAATASSYTVVSADVGDTIDVIVTASNAAGSASQTSAQTATVTGGGPGTTITLSTPFGTANAPVYATFQSHNYRTVATADGIFLSYFTNWSGTDGGSGDTGDDIVTRSTNGGSSWSQLIDVPIQGKHGPMSLTADANGNIYGTVQGTAWTGGRVYMFPKSASFANGGTDYLTLPNFNTGANKFTSMYDPNTNVLWSAAEFYMGKTTLTCQSQIGNSGTAACSGGTPDASSVFQWQSFTHPVSEAEYPFLSMGRDTTDANTILFAWTNAPEATSTTYYNIRFIFSVNDGATFRGTSSSSICAASCTFNYPIDGSDTGPSWLMSPSSETAVSPSWDGPWLENVYMQDGDFMFTWIRCQRAASGQSCPISNAGAPEYARFTYTSTAASLVNQILAPTCISTGTLCPTPGGAGAVFAGDGTVGATIYMADQRNSAVVVLKSSNSGSTWQDQAGPSANASASIYALSGGFQLTAGGQMVGAYLDNSGNQGNTIKFFTTG